MATFELDGALVWATPKGLDRKAAELGIELSLNNIRWLTRVRWAVVCIFFVVGFFGRVVPGLFTHFGFKNPSNWLLFLATALALANVLFSIRLHRLEMVLNDRVSEADLWLQIVVDLIAVTVLVHFVGSTNTPIAFVYLFHAILACIFFPRGKSFLVAALAAGLYCACVAVELFWKLPSRGTMWPKTAVPTPEVNIVFAGLTLFVWFAAWFLTSTLAEAARLRERQLNAANELLVIADREKSREVIQSAHDLKAPFSGIQSSIEVLRLKHWDETPESVRAIIERIEKRTQALAMRIRDMLLLGGLKLRRKEDNAWTLVDLPDVVNEALHELQDRIRERGIGISLCVEPVKILAKRRTLLVLVSNIVANAVFYSHDHGGIELTITDNDAEALLIVSDHGIGIKEEALSHIFDEYYRTQEAARFNRLSTGLGLAIVKRAATELGLKIQVDSEASKGTTFTVLIPKTRKERECDHG